MINEQNTDGNFDRDITMPIAIVGIGFRGPGDATNVQNLWKMMCEGRESWSEIPKQKWNHEAFYHPDSNRHGTYNVTGGHFLQQDISRWDAPFFQMSPTEAAALDPQQRLLLECTYEAMENSGTTMEEFCGSDTSVFAGAFTTDYTDILWRDPESTPMYQCTNASHCRSNLANRISYFFDLRGQSVGVDTACSTSLVGLHLGCQSLRTGESKLSIVSGANVILSHDIWVTMSMMRFLSPDGRCYTFDERANGYARGEGVGVLLLKPLSEALRDGNTIRAVIRGTGSSQDGRTPGITMPNALAQEELIKSVYRRSGLNPLGTSYVECHGTGTQAGDPLETRAISRVFGQDRETSNPVRIGSVKTNVGHLEAASGVAGVIKTVLMLENKVYLPNRNFRKANPRIPLEEWKLKIPLSVEPWNGPLPRRASVNSFGYGGAIAHVILESAEDYMALQSRNQYSRITKSLICGNLILDPTKSYDTSGHSNDLCNGNPIGFRDEKTDELQNANLDWTPNGSQNGRTDKFQILKFERDPARLFVLSSFDEIAGKRQAENLRQYLNERLDASNPIVLEDLAFTLNERRTHHIWRAAIVARSANDLIQSITCGVPFSNSGTKKRKLGFVFTGQGAQWCGMGKELIASYPVFRASLEKIDIYLKAIGASFDVIDELTKDPQISEINRALYSQPLCSAVQIALVDLLASFGVKPSSVTGHSSGEIAGAYAIGALSLEDAIRVAYFRGVASTNLAKKITGKGSMMAAGLSKEEALPLLAALTKGKAVIACSNSPSSITISGDDVAIEELCLLLERKKIFVRKLVVEVAYHSHHMTQVEKEYRDSISEIKVQPGVDVEFFSSVTGHRAAASDLGPDYWVSNMLNEVKFDQSLRQLCLETCLDTRGYKRNSKAGVDDVVELGPHSALAGPIKQIIGADAKLCKSSIAYHSALTRNKNAVDTILALLSSLFKLGYPINMASINRPTGPHSPSILVDLPPYSWNHSKAYWHESRKSKAYRNRPFPRTDLLGALEKTSSPMEPRWSNYIRLSEIPWIRDHVIQSNIVYPAAGYIVMAIEAAAQRATQRSVSNIIGYNLREVVIGAALIIPENPGEVEIAVTLRSYSESMRSPSDVWDEFIVSSVSGDDRWTEHCRGLVSVQALSKVVNVIDGELQKAGDQNDLNTMVDDFRRICQQDIEVPQFYETIAGLGLEYGETFACMTKARSGPGSCIGHIKIPNTAAVMPKEYQFPFVVHPATLDSLFHTIFVALGADEMKDPAVPVSVDEIFVSSGITCTPGHELISYTSTKKKDNRTISASLIVVDASQRSECEPVISIRGISCTALNIAESKDITKESRFCAYNFEWRPDVNMLSPEGLEHFLKCETAPSQINIRYKSEIAAFYLLKSAVGQIKREASTPTTSYQQGLWNSLKSIVETTIEKNMGSLSEQWVSASEAEQNLLLDEVKCRGPEGNALYKVGRRLPEILRGELAAASLAGEIDISGFFIPSNMFIDHTPVAKFIELLAFKSPNLSILACGRLAGFFSIPVLAELHSSTSKHSSFSKFEYADDEFDLTDLVRAKCPTWEGLICRKQLDIELDPANQEIELESYDIVITFHPVGSTKIVRKILQNAHKLLKPGGKLVLVRRNRISLTESAIFGFLPSMIATHSASSDEETTHSEGDWASFGSETGFFHDTTVYNLADKTKESAVFLTAIPIKVAAPKYPKALIVGDGCDLNVSTQHLQEQLSTLKINAEITSFENARPKTDQICIVLSEPKTQLLTETTQIQWNALKDLLLRGGGVLWVTRGATVSSFHPESNVILGLMRTIRSENGEIPMLTLDLDFEKHQDEFKSADFIVSLFERYFLARTNQKELESEYAERNGVLMIPRLLKDNELTNFISSSADKPKPEFQPFRQHGRPLRMHVGTPGLLDSMYFIDDGRFNKELPADWLQIEIKATGVNFKDVMMALGQITVKDLGIEASGIVTALGREVTQFQLGDKVVSYGTGLFGTHYCGPARMFHKFPDHLSFEKAASIPITYATAYYSCHYIARLQKEETVLVHAASGGLGQAIIELCQLAGAEVYATVGTADKKEFLMQHFKIPEDHIFFSRNGSFAKGINRMTRGKGVDVIMNSLAGENLRLTWDCIAPWGRFVELGQRDIMINTRLEMEPLKRNATFSAFLLDDLVEQRPDVARKVFSDVIELFSVEAIRGPAQIHTYPITEVEKALRMMQTGGHMGKLVVLSNPDAVVKVIPRDNRKNLLRPDVSYMLVGGLGGIGRETALWMTDHGARNLIFINRSGLSTQEARDTVEVLKIKGTLVAVYSCDITNAVQVEATLAQAAKEMPPIKGVIQGAMDTLFENMVLEDFKSVLEPKVQGTWNLHNLLPEDMDFFIMESSVSGIVGNTTQAAYAAGNTFLDSFASYRNSRGLPATTIDLGAISDVGYLAKNPELRGAMQRQGFELTDKKTLTSLIHFAINNPRRPGLLSQSVTGLGVWEEGSSLVSLELPLFAHFRSGISRSSWEAKSASSAGQLRKSLRTAKTLEQASNLICAALVEKIASRAGLGVENVNIGHPASDYGIDSLVAVEIRNWISKEMGATIPILELLANMPLSQLAMKISQRSGLVQLNEAEHL